MTQSKLKSFLSRKLVVTLVAVAVGVGLAWFDRLTPEVAALLKWVVGLY